MKESRVFKIFGISLVFLFITAYQVRSSLQTVYLARNLDYFVPFLVEPFSNQMYRIADRLYSEDPAIHGDVVPYGEPWRLLAVNHRPFRGLSVYLTQLWHHQNFSISMTRGDSPAFEASYLFGHCTCSVSPAWQLAQTFVLPPLACVLLAYFVLLRRPDSVLGWAFAALLLSLSQIDLFPERAGFTLLADPVAWPDAFRVPAIAYRAFVQNLWPAAFIIFGANLFSRNSYVRQQALRITVPFFCLAVVRAVLAVAWSENYLPFVPLYHWLENYSTELMGLSFGLAVWLCFLLSKRSGVLAGCVAFAALVAFYGAARPITGGSQVAVTDIPIVPDPIHPGYYPQTVFRPSIPDLFVAPSFVIAVFATISFLIVLLCQWRQTNRWLMIALAFLIGPVVFVLGVLQGNWTLLWHPLWVINCFTFCTGLGLLGVCRYCLKAN